MERTPNARQREVIDELNENLIVFASAGTGKTFTVANRIRAILERTDAQAEEILCLTFTVKACDELREDIQSYVGKSAKGVVVQTIHGFCLSLLREEEKFEGGKRSFMGVCDETDTEELLKRILIERHGENTQFRIFSKNSGLRNLASEIKHSRWAGDFYSADSKVDYQRAFLHFKRQSTRKYEDSFSYYERYFGKTRDEAFERVMEESVGEWLSAYDERLAQSNLVDFDDLLLLSVQYLKDDAVRARWEKRFKYIIVDEMQDTSVLEYAVLKRIFGKNNIMLCGDFFQTIYEWRNARPELVLGEFIKEYTPRRLAFTENYRATQTLANASFDYLKKAYPDIVNAYLPADIEVKSENKGEKIQLIAFENFSQEAEAIYDFAKRNPPKTANELCVITRSNKYAQDLAFAFERLNAENTDGTRVEFFTTESHMRFYKNPVVKDALSALRLALDPSDEISMERLTERYIARVGLKTIRTLRDFAPQGLRAATFASARAYRDGDEYFALLSALKKGNTVVYDTETTGLDLSCDEAIQIAAIKIDENGNILQRFERMIIPTVPISREAYETHGFDEDYIKTHGGVCAKEAYEAFSEFVKGCVLVGHNSNRFDAPLVKRQLADLGLPPLDIQEEYDTLTIAQCLFAELPDYKLSTLCSRYGVVNEAAHDAMGDITATAKVLSAMAKERLYPNAETRRLVFAQYRERFEKFFAFLEELRALIRDNKLSQIMPFITMKMHLESKNPEHRETIARLNAVFQGEESEDCHLFLRTYLTELSLYASRADMLYAKHAAVPVITVHQAKGCEFDTVIIAGADDGNFPSYLSKGTPEEESEKKIFYVAITRAKKRLFITYSTALGRRMLSPSPYTRLIAEEYVRKNELWDK